jgi:uncharacterized protein YggE
VKQLCFFLVLCLYAAPVGAESAQRTEERQLLRVEADAVVYVKPDRVHLTLGVFEDSADLRAAGERMNETLKKALAFCRANGVQEKDIRTSHLSIRPDYRYDKDRSAPSRRYVFDQTFTVTLEDAGKYETLLSALLGMGINRVDGVSFSSSELRKYKDEARIAAIRAAREKAEFLTGEVGLRPGRVVNIAEDAQTGIPYPGGIRPAPMLQQNAARSAPDDGGAESFALGRIPVRARVVVTWELE